MSEPGWRLGRVARAGGWLLERARTYVEQSGLLALGELEEVVRG